MFRYESAQHWVDVFRAFYDPVHRAFAALAPDQQQQLEGEIVALLAPRLAPKRARACRTAASTEA